MTTNPEATLFAFCKRCKTLYLNAQGEAVVCPCGKTVGRFEPGYKLGVRTEKEPPTRNETVLAMRVVKL